MFDHRTLIAIASVDEATIEAVASRVAPDRVDRVVDRALHRATKVEQLAVEAADVLGGLHPPPTGHTTAAVDTPPHHSETPAPSAAPTAADFPEIRPCRSAPHTTTPYETDLMHAALIAAAAQEAARKPSNRSRGWLWAMLAQALPVGTKLSASTVAPIFTRFLGTITSAVRKHDLAP